MEAIDIIKEGGLAAVILVLLWQVNGLRKSLRSSEEERKEITNQIIEQYFKPIKKETNGTYNIINNNRLDKIEEMLKDLKKNK